MERITKPEKWKDSFFLKLKPIEKLVFIYLYENCDDAGFLDINFEKMMTEIGINNQEISSALKSIEKTFLVNSDSDRLWIKKFLLHQNRLPLDLKTPEGNFIKYQIEQNTVKFNAPAEFLSILKNIKKLVRAKSEPFAKPTIQEVIAHFKAGDWHFISEQEINEAYTYYESKGWKVGSKKMVSWQLSFIGWFNRNFNKHPRPSNTPAQNNSKMQNIVNANEKIKGFDFNTIKQ